MCCASIAKVKAGAIDYVPLVTRASFPNYLAIISATLVLIFFGFGNEALGYYAKLIAFTRLKNWVLTKFGGESLAVETAYSISLTLYASGNQSQSQGLTRLFQPL